VRFVRLRRCTTRNAPAYKALSEMAGDVRRGEGKGQAQVATASYRVNYDSIFGARQEVGQA
jgi:hypothetical protein